MQRRPVEQTSPYELAIGADESITREQTPAWQLRRSNHSPRGPPLPPDVALAYQINDAVKVSGLSRSSLYELLAAGQLRSIKVAGRRLIPAEALRELLGVS